MTAGIFGSTGSNLVPQTRAFVIYDKTTGEVFHVHRSVSFPANPQAREGPEERARRLAGEISPDVGVIEVGASDVNQRKPVRVDIHTRQLVESDS